MRERSSASLIVLAIGFLSQPPAASQNTVVDLPGTRSTNAFYVANRAPLSPSLFMKLPIGSIRPQGWLRHQLELERDGMTGHLEEISPWLDFNHSAWGNAEGTGERGWEELPYWLKGVGDLGYVLKDSSIIAKARRWIEMTFASQRDDGWFGPRALLTGLKGKPDLWPHMVMLNVLQSYYEFSGDKRVIGLMTGYFQWENRLPPSAFGEGYWPRIRAGDNIESVYWLYNRTGIPWLLELATKIHTNMARWDEDVANWHNVNFAQGFRAGSLYGIQSGDSGDLASAERNYRKAIDIYGQFPGGTFVSDENSRPGYIDPRGGFETCGIVEFMHSFEMLTKITGKPVWADRCEEIAFNSLPAAMTSDQKALHYLTCANQIQLDRGSKAPDVQNSGNMFAYMPYEDPCRCCQHNVSHGWPYYAEELWLATADNGLCASLYAASTVTAKVGSGVSLTITETTDYPFRDTIGLKLSLAKSVKFPLYLRVPGWCSAATASINGTVVDLPARPGAYIVLTRTWNDADMVVLRLPMKLSVRRWTKNQNAVSVDYGPLSFSLAIKERWESFGERVPGWPQWEVYADSPWNFGLVLDPSDPSSSLDIVRDSGPLPRQPFTQDAIPVRVKARARRIPQWQADSLNVVGRLQPSPARTTEAEELVTLIPMGAARLRISCFPTVSTNPEAYEWVAASK